MPEARLKFKDQAVSLSNQIVTCGRAPDNVISFADDANVSRYHIEIEPRSDGYWIIDLNSSNGTTVNGEALIGDRPLNDGDKIVLGGSSELEFVTGPDADEPAADPAQSATESAAVPSI